MSDRSLDRFLKECPSLPISGRRGAKKLGRLRRRADFLQTRIEAAEVVGKDLAWDKSELNALDWVIQRVIELEEELYRSVSGE